MKTIFLGILCISVCVFLVPLSEPSDGPAFTKPISGNQMMKFVGAYQQTRNPTSTPPLQVTTDSYFFMGYVEGATFANMEGVCVPRKTTLGQLYSIVADFFNKHPAQWNDNASSLVALAVKGAFPCSKQDTQELSPLFDGNKLMYLIKSAKIETGLDTHNPKTVQTDMEGINFKGFVSGVRDSYDTKFCYSPNVTGDQEDAIVIQYMDAHPAQWNISASDLIFSACKRLSPVQRESKSYSRVVSQYPGVFHEIWGDKGFRNAAKISIRKGKEIGKVTNLSIHPMIVGKSY
ncbi:MAG: hypothetical protein C5B54_10945 [Acidobacteria bacterium]|nr:MAG: hypothetical protein C5B54_10945 [Acidobacteriota bacterium]